jgi:hypothetical protein
MGKSKPAEFYKQITTNWTMGSEPRSGDSFVTQTTKDFAPPGITYGCIPSGPKNSSNPKDIFGDLRIPKSEFYTSEVRSQYTPQKSVWNEKYDKRRPVKDSLVASKTNYELGTANRDFVTANMVATSNPETRTVASHPNYKARSDLGYSFDIIKGHNVSDRPKPGYKVTFDKSYPRGPANQAYNIIQGRFNNKVVAPKSSSTTSSIQQS